MMAARNLLILSLFLWTFAHAQTYLCTPGQPCEVDCENDDTARCNTTDGSQVTIDAESATSLTLICYKERSCRNILVECPISHSNSSFCNIQCSLDLACQHMEIHTHNTTDINLICNDNELDRNYPKDTTCQNITIDGEYNNKEDVAPPIQNIAIDCGDEGNALIDTPSCDNISYVSIQYIPIIKPW